MLWPCARFLKSLNSYDIAIENSFRELAREVHKATLPYNLNFFSATAAEVACEMHDLLRPRIEKIITERERLLSELRMIRGVEPVPSSANFMVARADLPPRKIFEELLARDMRSAISSRKKSGCRPAIAF